MLFVTSAFKNESRLFSTSQELALIRTQFALILATTISLQIFSVPTSISFYAARSRAAMCPHILFSKSIAKRHQSIIFLQVCRLDKRQTRTQSRCFARSELAAK